MIKKGDLVRIKNGHSSYGGTTGVVTAVGHAARAYDCRVRVDASTGLCLGYMNDEVEIISESRIRSEA